MEKLKTIRENANLKQKDIAKILGIDRSTYSSYEIERDTMPLKHINTLCNYFDVSLDYIYGLNKRKKYPNSKPDINILLMQTRLKALRKMNKLTQLEISQVLNTSRSTWTGYEYGERLISTLLLYDLCKKYHSSMDYILGKIDEIK